MERHIRVVTKDKNRESKEEVTSKGLRNKAKFMEMSDYDKLRIVEQIKKKQIGN